MTINPYSNGNGHLDEADIHNGFAHQLEEPVQINSMRFPALRGTALQVRFSAYPRLNLKTRRSLHNRTGGWRPPTGAGSDASSQHRANLPGAAG